MRVKLVRQTLPEQIAQTLADYIVDEGLQAGDLLPSTATLSADFGVSRAVMREAWHSLAGQGLVEVINGRGAVVRPLDSEALRLYLRRAAHIDPATLAELNVLRPPLEILSAGLAAGRRSDDDLARLRQTVATLRDSLENPRRFGRLDAQFHLDISVASGNKMLYFLLSAIYDTLAPPASRGPLKGAQQQHESLLAAIAGGDRAAAEAIAREHFALS